MTRNSATTGNQSHGAKTANRLAAAGSFLRSPAILENILREGNKRVVPGFFGWQLWSYIPRSTAFRVNSSFRTKRRVRSPGIQHVQIRPRSPHLNGKVERSHRIDDQDFYQLIDQGGISDNIHPFNKKLREWDDYYNYHRTHGALQGRTPYERLIEKSRADVSQGS